MTVRAAAANGNLTTAGTWGAVDATSYLNSESGNTALTTSFVYSSTFTPGAITIDGVAVKIASRAASPTGTMSIDFFDNTAGSSAGTVTVNVSDVPPCSAVSGTTSPVTTAEGGWFFIKFGSPITLTAGHAYKIGAKTSSASQVNLWRDTTAGNWSRYLRSTTTGAPIAGDDMVITGEWTAAATVTTRTVTMDSTAAADYGNNAKTQVTPSLAICKGGTLSMSASASTTYILQQSGYVVVYYGGTLALGASIGDIPPTSTMTLQFDCDVASGDFGLVMRNGSTRTVGGSPRTAGKSVDLCYLSADAAGGATSLTVDTDTGWKSGDIIVIASTTQTYSEIETATLNADATSSGLSLSAGLSHAHSGTAPIQAEVALLTRNVVVKPTNTARKTFIYNGAQANVADNWLELSNCGVVNGKDAYIVNTTTGSTLSATYLSIHDSADRAVITGSPADGWTFSHLVIYNCTGDAFRLQAGSTSCSLDRAFIASNNGGGLNLVTMSSGAALTNITCTSCGSGPLGVASTGTAAAGQTAYDGWAAHSNNGFGASFGSLSGYTFTNFKGWRNGNSAFFFQGNTINNVFTNITLFGNGSGGAGNNISITGAYWYNNVFTNLQSNGDTTYAVPNGILTNGVTQVIDETYFWSSAFSKTSGILTAHTLDFNSINALSIRMSADNTYLNATSSPPVAFSGVTSAAEFHSQLTNRTVGEYATYKLYGNIVANSSVYYPPTDASGLSEELQPSNASNKLTSQSKIVPVNAGETSNFEIFVRKNSFYTGAAPRLILKRQDSMGITSDTVCALLSVGADTWQGLTYTTPAAPQDGAWEFVVDCDTAGSVYVDAWS